jgi:hypothetical protein
MFTLPTVISRRSALSISRALLTRREGRLYAALSRQLGGQHAQRRAELAEIVANVREQRQSAAEISQLMSTFGGKADIGRMRLDVSL